MAYERGCTPQGNGLALHGKMSYELEGSCDSFVVFHFRFQTCTYSFFIFRHARARMHSFIEHWSDISWTRIEHHPADGSVTHEQINYDPDFGFSPRMFGKTTMKVLRMLTTRFLHNRKCQTNPTRN